MSLFVILASTAGYAAVRNPKPLNHPASEWEAVVFLAKLGCLPPFLSKLSKIAEPIFLLGLATGIILLAIWIATKVIKANIKFDFANLAIAVALATAVLQWHASLEHDATLREQQATEKYEREIDATNNSEQESPAIRCMMDALFPRLSNAPDEYERIRYVYLQLDNLEYALERYREDRSSAYTTARAVMTFESRCRSEEFRRRASKQLVAASYSPVVRRVARSVLQNF